MSALHRPDWLAWAQRSLDSCSPSARLAHELLYPLGPAARNNELSRQEMRALGRGGMLDVHQGETGFRQVIAPGSNDLPLLRLAATTRNNPQVVTVGFDVLTVSEAPAPPPAPDFLLQAVIRWGTGKSFSEAIIDARRGIQFTVTASILNVDVRYVGTTGPTFRVSAGVGYGSPQDAATALTFTEAPAQLLAGALSGAFRVPAYATRVAWFANDAPLVAPIPAATIQQRGDAVIAGRIVSQTASVAGAFVTIENGVDFIRLFNNSASARTYGLIYELHL